MLQVKDDDSSPGLQALIESEVKQLLSDFWRSVTDVCSIELFSKRWLNVGTIVIHTVMDCEQSLFLLRDSQRARESLATCKRNERVMDPLNELAQLTTLATLYARVTFPHGKQFLRSLAFSWLPWAERETAPPWCVGILRK